MEFQVFPGEISPEMITKALGIEPSSVNVRGAEVENRFGRRRSVRTNGWFLEVSSGVKSLDIRRHLRCLLDLLIDKHRELENFKK